VVWFFGFFWNEALSEPPAALCICHGKAGKSQRREEEPGRSPEQLSPPLSFSEELQCKAQSCYALVEGEVGRKCLRSEQGMDPKSLAHLYSHPVWHRLEMGPVSEEMDLSAISYTPMRSCQSDVVASAGLATAAPALAGF